MLGAAYAIGLLGAVGTTWAQTTFEPTNFDVTEALISQGVNVSAIPALEGLLDRSSSSACSIAVGYMFNLQRGPLALLSHRY
jgi:hypothetical protein